MCIWVYLVFAGGPLCQASLILLLLYPKSLKRLLQFIYNTRCSRASILVVSIFVVKVIAIVPATILGRCCSNCPRAFHFYSCTLCPSWTRTAFSVAVASAVFERLLVFLRGHRLGSACTPSSAPARALPTANIARTSLCRLMML